MNLFATLLVLIAAISMVMADASCPRGCEHPKSKEECDRCLNEGYSEIVHGKSGNVVDNGIGKLLKPGAYAEISGGRCWIHMLGLGNDKCGQVAAHLFGNGRCSGFAGYEYNLVSGKCWAKFKNA